MAQKSRMCKQVGDATPEKMHFKSEASDTATCSPSFRAEISGSVPGTASVTNMYCECRTVKSEAPGGAAAVLTEAVRSSAQITSGTLEGGLCLEGVLSCFLLQLCEV